MAQRLRGHLVSADSGPFTLPLGLGDLVYVIGFDFAEVIGFGCCINRRGRGGTGAYHIRYADGQFFHVQRHQLLLVSRKFAVAGSSWDGRQCPICDEHSFLLGSSCGHAACCQCWARWAHAQLPRGRYSELHCWGDGCEVELCNLLWGLLHSVSSVTQCPQASLPEAASMHLWLRRRRLQTNPLFPPAVQVDCRQRGCCGLGYLGSDLVMCFFCEDQWSPDAAVSESACADGEDPISGTKRCPKCNVPIEKSGGCDHMTCVCRYEFWWSTLQPYHK